MAKTYRVAVIGRTGKGNYGHGIDTVWSALPNVDVLAVADEHEVGLKTALPRTKAKTAYADYREMLDKERPEIVGIGPRWVDCHHELSVAAAEFGCHVFMEKPFTPTLVQADNVIRVYEMRHLKLALAHQTRQCPVTHLVKKLIASGEIGQLLEMRGRGKEDHRGGGEDLWVLGSHILDLMRFFAGDPADCHAVVTQSGHPVTKADVVEGNEGLGPIAGDTITARYAFPNSVAGHFASYRKQGGSPSRFGLQLLGSKGVIEVFTGYAEPAWILRDSSWSPGRSGAKWQKITSNGIDQPETITARGLDGGNVAAVKDLMESIEQDRQPLCSMYDGRASVEMILAVYESHRVGRTVPLPLKTRENPLSLMT
ncbi:MAG: Gfo/Idh/MocA family oxidoreductase [Planctomycetaceae bacterium]|nr:Gfo/Idh/MocA family oxidoreductase [Planctomycetaceae bacterium]